MSVKQNTAFSGGRTISTQARQSHGRKLRRKDYSPAFHDERFECLAELQDVDSILAPKSLQDLGVDVGGLGTTARWGAISLVGRRPSALRKGRREGLGDYRVILAGGVHVRRAGYGMGDGGRGR